MNPRRHGLHLVVAATIGLAVPASAHHSLAAGFDVTKMLTMSGVVKDMKWTNPHSWLTIEVKEDSGAVAPWEIEFGTPNALYRNGWRKDDLPVGTVLTVTGYPARDGSKQLAATSVKLPDGRTLFSGQNDNAGR